MYEMIRVAKHGVLVIEPQDPVIKMPLLLMLSNLLNRNAHFLNKLWNNRFSFEPVGNFVYKVSEREFEKLAAGLGLPIIGFKKINPNYWFKGADLVSTERYSKKFFFIRLKKFILDVLVRIKTMPSQVLATVIFKQLPDEFTIALLKKNGYHLVYIPQNPYLDQAQHFHPLPKYENQNNRNNPLHLLLFNFSSFFNAHLLLLSAYKLEPFFCCRQPVSSRSNRIACFSIAFIPGYIPGY